MKAPRVGFFWRWYDLWVGAYWDRRARVLYLCPFPTLGCTLDFGPPEPRAVRLTYTDAEGREQIDHVVLTEPER